MVFIAPTADTLQHISKAISNANKELRARGDLAQANSCPIEHLHRLVVNVTDKLHRVARQLSHDTNHGFLQAADVFRHRHAHASGLFVEVFVDRFPILSSEVFIGVLVL